MKTIEPQRSEDRGKRKRGAIPTPASEIDKAPRYMPDGEPSTDNKHERDDQDRPTR
jgi:hypothetical protein